MSRTLSGEALDLTISVDGLGPAGLGGVAEGLCGGDGETVNVGPLLEFLLEVVVLKDRISSSVPDLHLGIGARIARVCLSDACTPDISGLDLLAVGTWVGWVGRSAGGETAKSDTSEDCSALEKVGVDTGKDVGHHGT